MQSKLKTLNSTKYKLNVDLSKAKNELKSLQKEMNSGKEVTAELAKKYDTDNAPSFINGILNSIAKAENLK